MIDFLHQHQQTPNFSLGETCAGKPVEVVARQVGNQAAFVFAKGHAPAYQQEKIFGIHQQENCPGGGLPVWHARTVF
ncbi:hypothetical protein HNP49_003066 [Pseudomonas fluvialis]|uniref:Uncharacterized protein n=1 Tax=Pseudomonas fluvialis TaxID=1793966 RepID=A0A7X0BUP9_9PSED|nr:hypothetical protein [Pseudomonas fluvialis]